jgi:hypothetical protein
VSAPDYIVCLNCETPCYTFEWKDGKIVEALCEMCGADDVDEFITEEGLEALASPEYGA